MVIDMVLNGRNGGDERSRDARQLAYMNAASRESGEVACVVLRQRTSRVNTLRGGDDGARADESARTRCYARVINGETA